VLLEGLGQLKNPMTSSGIEPATFRLGAYCLNQLLYCVPSTIFLPGYRRILTFKITLNHYYFGKCIRVQQFADHGGRAV
jgi:hypothetical protein